MLVESIIQQEFLLERAILMLKNFVGDEGYGSWVRECGGWKLGVGS